VVLEALVDVHADFVYIDLLLDAENFKGGAQAAVDHEFEVHWGQGIQFVQVENIEQEPDFVLEFTVAE
jgi:hypothetical protein